MPQPSCSRSLTSNKKPMTPTPITPPSQHPPDAMAPKNEARRFAPAILLLSLLWYCSLLQGPLPPVASKKTGTVSAPVTLPPTQASGNIHNVTSFTKEVPQCETQAKPGSNPVGYHSILVTAPALLFNGSLEKAGSPCGGPATKRFTCRPAFDRNVNTQRSAPGVHALNLDWLLPGPGKTGRRCL